MTILITGGSSGLGAAITKLCCETFNDARIFFTYYSSQNAALLLQSKYLNSKAVFCDFKDSKSISSLCAIIENSSIDILINNAFTGLQQTYFHKLLPSSFLQSFNENILPVLQITQAFIISARKQKSGKIITVLSAYVENTPPSGLSKYIAEKNYLLAMHRSWAVENSAFKITSNCVSPGFMLTSLNKNTDERIVETMVSQHPLKALLEPSIVAETVITLIKSNSFLNGQNIFVNSSLSI